MLRTTLRTFRAASLAPRFYTTEAPSAVSPLFLRLKGDVKDAMRNKQKERLSVVKSVLADLIYLEKSPQAPTVVTDSTIQLLIQKSIKRREESINDFVAAGRSEQAEQEKSEIEILKVYLPTVMTDQEIQTEVKKVIEQLDAKGPKDMGRVMKELGNLDPAKASKQSVSEMVKKLLAGN